MIQGESRITNMVLKMLGEETIENIEEYVNEVSSRNFNVLGHIDKVNEYFKDSINEFISSLTEEELLDLRTYTGYQFKNINAILRNNWNYEINGTLTEDKINLFKQLSGKVSSIMSKFKSPAIDFVTYRGTTLDSFLNYGITNLSNLESLKGKYLYEQGFTSTSIIAESSYYKKTLDDGRYCNIGIKYLIPAENNDGALLVSNSLSYSANQNEFLLDKGTLSKVVDVKVENDSAVLTVVLVPKKVYDINYNMNNSKKI